MNAARNLMSNLDTPGFRKKKDVAHGMGEPIIMPTPLYFTHVPNMPRFLSRRRCVDVLIADEATGVLSTVGSSDFGTNPEGESKALGIRSYWSSAAGPTSVKQLRFQVLRPARVGPRARAEA
jgi:hypothetical protein